MFSKRIDTKPYVYPDLGKILNQGFGNRQASKFDLLVEPVVIVSTYSGLKAGDPLSLFDRKYRSLDE
jgi:hypothetical protein